MKKISNVSSWKYSNFISNKNFNFNRKYILKYVSSKLLIDSYQSIKKWKSYKSTPLLSLEKLNKKLKLKNIFYKDESKRFNLKSFKALGGAYAVAKISKGKKIEYAYTDEQRDLILDKFKSESKANISLSRYKGLGEMTAQQLWETTMDPEIRTLLKVTMEDALETENVFSRLMGDEVEPRREFIVNRAQFVSNLDL